MRRAGCRRAPGLRTHGRSVPEPPSTASANRRLAASNAAAAARVARLAALTAYAEALARKTYASRPDGVTARADAAEYLDAELEACSGSVDPELFDAIEGLRNSVVAFLSSVITSLAPVIKARVATMQAGTQTPAAPSDPVVLTSVLTAALAGKLACDASSQLPPSAVAPATMQAMLTAMATFLPTSMPSGTAGQPYWSGDLLAKSS